MTIQQVPSRGRISIIRIQNFTMHRRQSVIRVVYGSVMMMFAILLASLDPLRPITDWIMAMREGSFVFNVWKEPPYKLQTEVWIFNYTNMAEFLEGKEDKMRVQEVGPFSFIERRVNSDMKIESGLLSFKPDISLTFLPDESVVKNLTDIHVTVPNIALLAVSTLAADKLNYFGNAGAYYSIQALGSKLSRNLSADEFLWGYHDPIVTLANNILPGWIDFGKIGILDRFYGLKTESVVVNIDDPNKQYAIETWDGSAGLYERGFTDLNSSTLCNRIEGSFEGLLVTPNVPKDKVLPIFRKQVCRAYPFIYNETTKGNMGFEFYRYLIATDAFRRSSPYSCPCEDDHCPPDGFVDISKCYYGFPITLSKPHWMDVDPAMMETIDGLKPEYSRHYSKMDIVPSIGVPVALRSSVQVNLAVRTALGNPITKPFNGKMLPLLWCALYCEAPSPGIVTILKLRFIVAPIALIILELFLFLGGMFLCGQGLYRIWKPRYKIIESSDPYIPRIRKKSSLIVPINVSDNMGFHDDLDKQAVSLLSICEDDRGNRDCEGLVVEEELY